MRESVPNGVVLARLHCKTRKEDRQRVIIIIKRISRVPIYHTKWEHRALYNNTNDRRTHSRTHTLSIRQGDRHGCEKQFRRNY